MKATMEELRGIGKPVVRLSTDKGEFEVVRFVDESWAVRRNGVSVGYWMPAEKDACIKAFVRMTAAAARSVIIVDVPSGTLGRAKPALTHLN